MLLNEIKIIGLLHISQGTWVPMLHLTKHIFPRCDFEQLASIPEECAMQNLDISWEGLSASESDPKVSGHLL